MQLLSIVLTLIVVAATWYLASLLTTYNAARKVGLPIYITPVNMHNLFWLVFSVPLRPLLRRILPSRVFLRFELATTGFEPRTRREVRDMFPDTSYVMVGPGIFQIWTSDLAIWKQYASHRDLHLSDMSQGLLLFFWGVGCWRC